jgi:hypothetical protein
MGQSHDAPGMIKIPQEEYQKFIDHLPVCKRSQDEIKQLKVQVSEMGQK